MVFCNKFGPAFAYPGLPAWQATADWRAEVFYNYTAAKFFIDLSKKFRCCQIHNPGLFE